jgi:hypothetical protein
MVAGFSVVERAKSMIEVTVTVQLILSTGGVRTESKAEVGVIGWSRVIGVHAKDHELTASFCTKGEGSKTAFRSVKGKNDYIQSYVISKRIQNQANARAQSKVESGQKNRRCADYFTALRHNSG